MAFVAATISPLGAGQAQAADGDCAQELECLVVASEMEDGSRVLEIARSWHGDGEAAKGSAYIFPNKNSENQRWQFRNTGDGSFQMIVRDSKKCLSSGMGWSLEQDCTNTDEQKYYLQPSPSGGFMIRSVKDDMCLNGLGGHSGQNFVYKSNHAGPYGCASGDEGSVFNIYDIAGPDAPSGNTQAMMNLAAEYAMTKCDKDESYCKWETIQKGEPTYGPPVCRGDSQYNDTGSDAPFTFTKTEKSINSSTVGGYIQHSNEAGVTLQLGNKDIGSLTIAQKFTETWQKNYARTVGEEEVYEQKANFTIPDGHYGWLEEQPQIRKLTGKFVFDSNNWAQWEYGADANNPMVADVVLGGDGKQNNSLWTMRTSPNRPTSC
ncbi:RICIN domain-containing protein [Streptomyces nigrescens]